MMTRREANLRAEHYSGRIVWDAILREYRVFLNEWTRKQREERGYLTDDLEDAVLTLANMRRGY